MLITEAQTTDIPVLINLINNAYRGEESKKGWTTEAEILDGIRIDEQTLTDYFTQENITILKCTNEFDELVGTVYLELNTPKLYLGMFAVAPSLQGSGIGKMLLKKAELIALAQDCNTIEISVISTRTELIQWYERHGYVATGHSFTFEEIEQRFGDPKINGIKLIEMEKLLTADALIL